MFMCTFFLQYRTITSYNNFNPSTHLSQTREQICSSEMVLKHFPRLVSDLQFTETDLNDQIKKILILFIVEPLETNKIEFF